MPNIGTNSQIIIQKRKKGNETIISRNSQEFQYNRKGVYQYGEF